MLRAIRRRAAVAFVEESRKAGIRLTMNELAKKAEFGSVDSLRRALQSSENDDPLQERSRDETGELSRRALL